MIFAATTLKGSYEIRLQPYKDDRGWFTRSYCKKEFEEIGFIGEWMQTNHSFTLQKGAIRGLHYQEPPFREIKLVRCIRGAVYDVIVDIRKGSPTFLKWYGTELSAEKMNMLYIPEGFAHGFQTLDDNCELLYSHSEFYTPGHEGGLQYDDPVLKISWPLAITQVSERDKHHPPVSDNFKGI